MEYLCPQDEPSKHRPKKSFVVRITMKCELKLEQSRLTQWVSSAFCIPGRMVDGDAYTNDRRFYLTLYKHYLI